MKKGYIKRGGVIVSMYGDVICNNEDCPYIDDIGNCTNINAKCKYEKQRNDACCLLTVWQSLRCSSCHCSQSEIAHKCRIFG